MSRKAFIVIIAVILAFFGAIGWYFISGDKSGTNSGNTDVDSSNPFPFGQGPASNGNANTGSGDQTGDASSGGPIDLSGNQTGPARLRRISTVPTAGAVAFDVGSSTIIRYVERATGHVIETGSDSSSSDQISNITIPKIREALWATNGQNVVLRYLKDNEGTIRTFLGRISTTTKTIEGTFLADDIENIAV
ncbi:MAG TPA: hypothetical protein VHC46_01210, partial [Thermodesulfobacteriota bacterium]|nr:hypothetical protein [Thermodesulfobacteriota bacterium]